MYESFRRVQPRRNRETDICGRRGLRRLLIAPHHWWSASNTAPSVYHDRTTSRRVSDDVMLLLHIRSIAEAKCVLHFGSDMAAAVKVEWCAEVQIPTMVHWKHLAKYGDAFIAGKFHQANSVRITLKLLDREAVEWSRRRKEVDVQTLCRRSHNVKSGDNWWGCCCCCYRERTWNAWAD